MSNNHEIVRAARDRAARPRATRTYEDGWRDGFRCGFADAASDAFDAGFATGEAEGRDEGRAEAHDPRGFDAGYMAALADNAAVIAKLKARIAHLEAKDDCP